MIDEKGRVSHLPSSHYNLSMDDSYTDTSPREPHQVWSWGVNDGGALGRKTANVPDPANPGQFLSSVDLEAIPTLVDGLEEAGFRAVRAAAGDSVSLVISDEGKVKYWGSFRVSL